MVPEVLPVVRGVPVDPSSAAVRSANRNFPPAHPLGRAPGPSRVHIRGVPPGVQVYARPSRVDQTALAPGIREPQHVSFHLTCVARSEGEVGGLERVFHITRRISGDDEATSRRQDRVEREACGTFAIRDRPSADVQRLRTRIPDFDELVVARGTRVNADEERIWQRGLEKRGGGRSRKREEGFGLALRPQGGGCQDERREPRRSRTYPGTHGSRTFPPGP